MKTKLIVSGKVKRIDQTESATWYWAPYHGYKLAMVRSCARRYGSRSEAKRVIGTAKTMWPDVDWKILPLDGSPHSTI